MLRRGGDGGMEESGARSNDGDMCHTPAQHDGNALSHSPRIHHHKLATNSQFSQGHPTTRERAMNGSCLHALHFGTHAPCAEALWKTRRVIGPIPFRRHKTPVHNKNITPIPIRHFIPSATTTRHDTPVSSPGRSSKLPDPSKRRN